MVNNVDIINLLYLKLDFVISLTLKGIVQFFLFLFILDILNSVSNKNRFL